MSTYYSKSLIFFFCAVLSVSFPNTGQAGLLSTISKISKKADLPDAPSSKLNDLDFKAAGIDIPDGDTATVVMAKQDLNGQWQFTGDNGVVLDISPGLENTVVVIEKVYLPSNLSDLSRLPGNSVVIKDGPKLYQVRHSTSSGHIEFVSGVVRANVASLAELHKAMWYFDQPISKGRIRILGLDSAPSFDQTKMMGVNQQSVLEKPSMLRGQTIIAAGKLKDNKIQVAGNWVDIDQVKRLAQEYDFSLVVMDADRNLAPKKLLKVVESKLGDSGGMSTSEFLNRMNNGDRVSEFSVNPSGTSQVMIQTKPVVSNPNSTEFAIDNLAFSVYNVLNMVQSISVYRPDQERQKELDARVVYWLHSYVSFYLIFSTFLGVVAIGVCRRFLRWVWPTKTRDRFDYWIVYMGFRFVRLLVLLLLVVPLFGLPCVVYQFLYAVYKILYAIWRGLVWLFLLIIKPFKLLLRIG